MSRRSPGDPGLSALRPLLLAAAAAAVPPAPGLEGLVVAGEGCGLLVGDSLTAWVEASPAEVGGGLRDPFQVQDLTDGRPPSRPLILEGLRRGSPLRVELPPGCEPSLRPALGEAGERAWDRAWQAWRQRAFQEAATGWQDLAEEAWLAGRHRVGAWLAGRAAQAWRRGGRGDRAASLLEEAVESLVGTGGGAAARVALARGRLASWLRDPTTAARWLGRGLELAPAAAAAPGLRSEILVELATAEARLGLDTAALGHARRAAAVAPRASRPGLVHRAHLMLGDLALARGDGALAWQAYAQVDPAGQGSRIRERRLRAAQRRLDLAVAAELAAALSTPGDREARRRAAGLEPLRGGGDRLPSALPPDLDLELTAGFLTSWALPREPEAAASWAVCGLDPPASERRLADVVALAGALEPRRAFDLLASAWQGVADQEWRAALATAAVDALEEELLEILGLDLALAAEGLAPWGSCVHARASVQVGQRLARQDPASAWDLIQAGVAGPCRPLVGVVDPGDPARAAVAAWMELQRPDLAWRDADLARAADLAWRLGRWGETPDALDPATAAAWRGALTALAELDRPGAAPLDRRRARRLLTAASATAPDAAVLFLVLPRPGAFADARAAAPPGRLHLSFTVAPDEAWVVSFGPSPHGLRAASLPFPRTRLAAMVNQAWRRVDRGEPPARAFASLFTGLLAPVRDLLPTASEIRLAPDGELWRLPWAVLGDAAGAFPGAPAPSLVVPVPVRSPPGREATIPLHGLAGSPFRERLRRVDGELLFHRLGASPPAGVPEIRGASRPARDLAAVAAVAVAAAGEARIAWGPGCPATTVVGAEPGTRP